MTILDSYFVFWLCLFLFVLNRQEPEKMKMTSMLMTACQQEFLNKHSNNSKSLRKNLVVQSQFQR